MRKLKLDPDDLVVDTFASLDEKDGERGTVRAHATEGIDGCTIQGVEGCSVVLCWQPTNDPRLRLCVTPYLGCATNGWTCDYC